MNKTLFRILRGFCGLTQTELGEILGRKQNTIASYEIGTLPIPADIAEQMIYMVKLLGITDLGISVLQQMIQDSADAKATTARAKAGASQ